MTIRLSIALSLLSLAYFFCASSSLLGQEAHLDKGYNLNNVLFVEVDLQSSAYSQHPKSLDFAQLRGMYPNDTARRMDALTLPALEASK